MPEKATIFHSIRFVLQIEDQSSAGIIQHFFFLFAFTASSNTLNTVADQKVIAVLKPMMGNRKYANGTLIQCYTLVARCLLKRKLCQKLAPRQ